MCLSQVDPEPTRKYGIGYKSVRKLDNGEYECYDHAPSAGTVRYPLNQWITDPKDGNVTLDCISSILYRTGFHICLNKNVTDSLNGTTIKVRFRKVVATNCEHPKFIYGKQVVAREIMNLGEVT